jgi:hypothetical protein
MGQSQGKGGEPTQEEMGGNSQFASTRTRRPYQKPGFRFERVFETQALSCGKVLSHGPICRLNQKTS